MLSKSLLMAFTLCGVLEPISVAFYQFPSVRDVVKDIYGDIDAKILMCERLLLEERAEKQPSERMIAALEKKIDLLRQARAMRDKK